MSNEVVEESFKQKEVEINSLYSIALLINSQKTNQTLPMGVADHSRVVLTTTCYIAILKNEFFFGDSIKFMATI